MDPRAIGGDAIACTRVSHCAESRVCDGNGDTSSDVQIPQQRKSPSALCPRIPIIRTSSDSRDDRSEESPGSSPKSAGHGTNAREGVVLNPVVDIPVTSVILSSTNGQAMVVDRVAVDGDLCIAAESLAGEDTNSSAPRLVRGTSNAENGNRCSTDSSVASSNRISRACGASTDVEEQTLEKQLRAFVSQKLAATGNLDQAGICALQVLSKLTSGNSSPPLSAARITGSVSTKVRASPPGLEDVRKFSGEDPSSLPGILKRYSGCVRAALRRPGITSEQVNRALVRDVDFVLEGSALEFYTLMMDGKVEWQPVAPSLTASIPAGACESKTSESRIPSKWREVCDALHDKFLPGEGISRTCLSLLSLRQHTGESIAEYAARQLGINQRLSWLVERHGGMTVWEALQIGLFERGLPAELLRAQHAEPACVTFQECVDRSARNEVILSSRSSIESGSPDESTRVPAGDDAQGDPLKSHTLGKSNSCDATGDESSRATCVGENLTLHGRGQTNGIPQSTSTEKTSVKVESAAEESEPLKPQQLAGLDQSVNPPGTRENDVSGYAEGRHLQDCQYARQSGPPSKTSAEDGDANRPRTSVSETSLDKTSLIRSQLPAKQDSDTTAPSDRKRRRVAEDDPRLRSPRRPNKLASSEQWPCKIIGCAHPNTHPTLQCFYHPEFGPKNRARYDERRRSFMLRKQQQQREMGMLNTSDNCRSFEGFL